MNGAVLRSALASESQLHPNVYDDAILDVYRQSLAQHGLVRISPILRPGLAAELVEACRDLPLQTRYFQAQEDLSLSCDIGVAETQDLEQPTCIYQLMHALCVELPIVVKCLVGQEVERIDNHLVHLWSLEKGSYVDAGQSLSPHGLDAWLGLTAATWPTEYGGHTLWSVAGSNTYTVAPGFDTLDLFSNGTFRIPMVLQHVRTLTVRTAFHHIGESSDTK